MYRLLWCWLLLPCVAAFGPAIPLRGSRQNGHCLCMAPQINIRMVGRASGSEQWLVDAYQMYQIRLRPNQIDVSTEWHKTNDQLVKGVQADRSKGTPVVLLDPQGAKCTSEKFASNIYEWLEVGGSRLTLVIGAADGLPPILRYPTDGPKPILISLSDLTFTHQFARVVLIEQIYRASEIRKGSGYHK